MNKHKNLIAITFLTILISTFGSLTSFAGEWKQDEKGWWYQKDDGSAIINDWFVDPETNKTYHFDTFGYMNVGLCYINNKWYNFDTSGWLWYGGEIPGQEAIATNDGTVHWKNEPGILITVVAWATDDKGAVVLTLVNHKNSPLQINSVCKIIDEKFNEEFYHFSDNLLESNVSIAPNASGSPFFMAPDGHSVNLNFGETIAHFNLETDDYTYYVTLPIYYEDDILENYMTLYIE